MATPTSPISLSQIQAEFGGSTPISISEYLRGGNYVPSNQVTSPVDGVAIPTIADTVRIGMFRNLTKTATSVVTLLGATTYQGITFSANGTGTYTGWDDTHGSGGAFPVPFNWLPYSAVGWNINAPEIGQQHTFTSGSAYTFAHYDDATINFYFTAPDGHVEHRLITFYVTI